MLYFLKNVSIHCGMKRKKKYAKNKPPKGKLERYTDGLRQHLLDKQIPSDAALEDSLVTIVAHTELWIENYKGLLEYKEEQILVQTKRYLIRIEGEHLRISHYMEEHMMICGNIRNITYL